MTCVSATTDDSEEILTGTQRIETAWGVMCRAAKTDDGVVVALVNVLTVPVSLKLYDGNGRSIINAVDMYVYESVDLSVPLLLQSLEVRILLIHTAWYTYVYCIDFYCVSGHAPHLVRALGKPQPQTRR